MNLYTKIISYIDWWMTVFSSGDFNNIAAWYSDINKRIVKKQLTDNWVIMKLAPKVYIKKNPKEYIDFKKVSLVIDNDSYISLQSALEWDIIKQWHTILYCCTPHKSKRIKYPYASFNGSLQGIQFFHIWISQTFWIETKKEWYKIADKERALLDLIYLYLYWNWKFLSEMFLHHINQEKIEKYLEYYPKNVENFYIKHIKNAE